VSDIATPRLALRLVPIAGLEATIAQDRAALEAILEAAVPAVWFEEAWLAQWRLDQWRENEAYGPWSIRAIIETSSRRVIGKLNCHREPMPFVHAGTTAPAVELGYDIYDTHQRRGFGHEAVSGFFGWAKAQGVSRFVLSISPGNAASNALARKLGAFQIGSQIDETDGPEDVFLVEW
jgi:RimJ/RimL family protein N-acetyltransferase